MKMPLWRYLGTYGVILVFGSIGGLFFWIFRILGLVKIEGKGHHYLRQKVGEGNLIIAANHPSLIETFLIPVMFWPWGLFNPRYFIWSLPDKKLFPSWLRWLYAVGHCIVVDRADRSNNAKTNRSILTVLRNRGTMIFHPEGGRTDSQDRLNPGKAHQIEVRGERRMRKIRSSRLVSIAHKTDAQIVPLYVDVPFVHKANGFLDTLKQWLLRRQPITFWIGDVWEVPDGLEGDCANEQLAEQILAAGL